MTCARSRMGTQKGFCCREKPRSQKRDLGHPIMWGDECCCRAPRMGSVTSLIRGFVAVSGCGRAIGHKWPPVGDNAQCSSHLKGLSLMPSRLCRFFCFAALALPVLSASAVHGQSSPLYPNYPSETPSTFNPPTYGMDYERREVMIPARDGVKLYTVILVPKGARHAGILLTRTPYSARVLTTNTPSVHLGTTLWGYDNATETILAGGYIRVVQDIRGKYGSEGDYVMNRPLHSPLNPTPVDESTDAYDTIDWLVKNVPEANGKVGVLGISYDGYLSLMPLVHPHPALKCVVPMNPMVDGWRGDDWFHNGAFRQQNLPYIYEQTATRDNSAHWQSSNFDDYDTYMNAVSRSASGRR
jgi:predicted acyl esterase